MSLFPTQGATQGAIYRMVANVVKSFIGDHCVPHPRNEGLENAVTSLSSFYL